MKNLGNAKQESSSVNKIHESRGKVYKAGAVEPIICNYAHDTRCDGKCLIWKDKFLGRNCFRWRRRSAFLVLTGFMEIATSNGLITKIDAS